ncbi:hypothetical protein [Spirosoma montaniterrae]|uniref:Lipocalin-like domain-containing protein n=1 Tax=Spirosoma montaniterrae TaxID=1178516 RepID=A0A1P9WYF6_9BACT|nr:hypothetical protein [Spirosoma montaniterrae]AQG80412.1 hypothetical protein AWR27_14425 [Spirosoma montaniterrae]
MNLFLYRSTASVLSAFVLIFGLMACSQSDDDPQPLTKAELLVRTWEVQSATSAYGRTSYLFYEKGRSDNDSDLSAYRFAFRADGSYSFIDGSSSTYMGVWQLTDNDTSLLLDGDPLTVLTLTDKNLDFSFMSDETDTNGNVIQITNTYRLVPVQ